jgi:hypothetical protein
MNLCAFALNWSRKAVDELRIRPKFPATHVHAISIEGDTKKVVLRERTSKEAMGAGLGQATRSSPRVMHMFATATAGQVVALGQEPKIVETESAWSVGPSALS